MISIHAPRTGSDYAACVIRLVCADFNPRSPHGERHNPPDDDLLAEVISIHAPRTGSDERLIDETVAICPFQSTLPARGATPPRPTIAMPTKNFNPRSPHGERLVSVSVAVGFVGFQSTLPARGATTPCAHPTARTRISIHAPRTGSDCPGCRFCRLPASISIHAPRTGSDFAGAVSICRCCIFQSTLPARGATPAEGTNEAAEWHFNPRSPHGERRDGFRHDRRRVQISIHAPRTGSDLVQSSLWSADRHFNPRSPHGERPRCPRRRSARRWYFNPRSPHGERQHQHRRRHKR